MAVALALPDKHERQAHLERLYKTLVRAVDVKTQPVATIFCRKLEAQLFHTHCNFNRKAVDVYQDQLLSWTHYLSEPALVAALLNRAVAADPQVEPSRMVNTSDDQLLGLFSRLLGAGFKSDRLQLPRAPALNIHELLLRADEFPTTNEDFSCFEVKQQTEKQVCTALGVPQRARSHFCRSCGPVKGDVRTFEVQTRSADEPTTIFCECKATGCKLRGQRWRG